MIMNKDFLVKVLTAVVEGVKADDTLEGSFEFTVNTESTKDEIEWNVTTSYRVGNLNGQGGLVLIK